MNIPDIGLIPLKEYAQKNGRDPAVVRQKALRGGFRTAVKLGRDWFIDPEEEYGDNRIRSRKYIGAREKKSEKTLDKDTIK
ncbi:MAG: hypothetical protein LBJ11_10585 [Oscillospiraceae bacterium]|nr:hypothetical protein [Oscillospiraceae bacterium]